MRRGMDLDQPAFWGHVAHDGWATARRRGTWGLVMRALPALSLSAICLLAAPAAAQPVSFDRAIAFSGSTPLVEGTRRALEARRAGDEDIAGTARSLQVTAQPGMRIMSEQDRGFEGQITISQTWNLADLTGARRVAAGVEREVLDAERRAAALAARLEAARRWIDLWQVAALQEVIGEERALAVRTRELAERAVRAGVRTRVDQAEAEAYAAEVALRALSLDGSRHETSVALAVAMGQPPNAELAPYGELPEPMLPPDPERRLADVERLPTVAVHRLSAAAQRAHEVEVAAQYAPQVSVGTQVQRESPSGFIVEGLLGITLPTFDRGQRTRSSALAEAERSEGQGDQARLDAQRQLSLAIHDVEHQRTQEHTVSQTLLPASNDLVERRESAMQTGQGTVFELLDARRRLLAARARVVEARAARAWAEVRLWVLLAELSRMGEHA